jgi:hypothetical protein
MASYSFHQISGVRDGGDRVGAATICLTTLRLTTTGRKRSFGDHKCWTEERFWYERKRGFWIRYMMLGKVMVCNCVWGGVYVLFLI